MALTRARVVAGPAALKAGIESVVRATLTATPNRAKISADAREMREKLAAQFPGKNHWDLKFAPGGLVDIEFVAQSLQLTGGAAVLSTNTIAALNKLGAAGLLSSDSAGTLIATAKLEHALTQILRIALDGTLDPAEATPGLKALLVRAAGVDEFEDVEDRLASLQAKTRAIMTALL
jgi:glutamate-ammonia-ligase adenylyltransferase